LAYSAPYPRNVLCLEGEWSDSLRDRSTVDHTLKLLEGLRVVRKFQRKEVRVEKDLRNLLSKWSQKSYGDFGILYLAFHGAPGKICLGKESVELEAIAEPLKGRCHGRIIHFSSCSTLGVDRRRLTRLLRTTQAKLIGGYRGDVDWLDTAAFEIMLLRDFQWRSTAKGIDDYVRKHHAVAGNLGRRLGWRLEYL